MWYHSNAVKFLEVPFLNATLNIYTVGCEHYCNGCHSVDLQNINHPERKKLTKDILFTDIEKSKDLIGGICWLGGDPFLQFKDCLELSKAVKETYPELVNVVFTGYVLPELMEILNQAGKDLLLSGYIDFIIDGKWEGYVLGDPNCNQNIYHFNKNTKNFEKITYQEYITFKK